MSCTNAKPKDGPTLMKQLVEEIEETYKNKRIKNDVLTSILSKVKELNYDEDFLSVARQHVKVLNKIYARHSSIPHPVEPKFASPDECIAFYAARFFMDHIKTVSKSTLPFLLNYKESIKSVPIEAFSKPDNKSITEFESKLKFGTVLYAVVTNPYLKQKNLEFVEVRFICNNVDKIIMYHLDIRAFMTKAEATSCLGREFQLDELFKVLMLGTIDTHHFVAINSKIKTGNPESADVGLKTEDELPFDWKSYKTAIKYPTYAQYVRSHKMLITNNDLKNDMLSIGIDPYHTYSFDEQELPPCPPGFFAESFKKRESQKHLEEATKFVDMGDVLSALPAFDEALKWCPDNYKVFEERGKMYASMSHNNQFDNAKKAATDLMATLKLNPNSKVAKEELSNMLAYIGNRYQRRKLDDDARKFAVTALKVNKCSKDANDLLKKIDERIERKKEKTPALPTDLKELERERNKIKTLLNMKTD